MITPAVTPNEPPPSTAFPPSLLHWVAWRSSEWLLRRTDRAPALLWRFDPNDISWSASDGAVPLGQLSLSPAWPPAQSRVPLTQFTVSTQSFVAPQDPRAALVEHDFALFLDRLVALDRKLPTTFATLFPRDADGLVDWARSPFNCPPAEECFQERTAYLVLGELPCALFCAFCTRSLWLKLRDKTSQIPAMHLYDQLYRAATKLHSCGASEAAIDPGDGTDSQVDPLLFNVGGDEPTVHPDLASIFRLAGLRGYRPIRLTTSAVNRIDLDTLTRYRSAGLNQIEVPLYGATASTHDMIVGVPSHFEATIRALDNSRALGIQAMVHSVVMTLNAREAPAIPGLAREHGAEFLVFNLPIEDGPSRIPVRDLTPRLTSLAPSVLAQMDMRVPCLGIGTHLGYVSPETTLQRLVAAGKGLDPRHGWKFVHAPQCTGCTALASCSGLRRSYMDIHGDGELVPFG